jgi:hypothetical protein
LRLITNLNPYSGPPLSLHHHPPSSRHISTTTTSSKILKSTY